VRSARQHAVSGAQRLIAFRHWPSGMRACAHRSAVPRMLVRLRTQHSARSMLRHAGLKRRAVDLGEDFHMARFALVFLMGGLLIGASKCDRDRSDDDGNVEEGEGSAGTSGDGREECGPVTCERGEVCCNESCGICTAPDGACDQQFCTGEDAGTATAPFCGGIAG
jgi:hypothetical protein